MMKVMQKYPYLVDWICDSQKDLKNYNINHFYLILGNVSGYFEEVHGNRYLTLVLTNESKKIKNKDILGIVD